MLPIFYFFAFVTFQTVKQQKQDRESALDGEKYWQIYSLILIDRYTTKKLAVSDPDSPHAPELNIVAFFFFLHAVHQSLNGAVSSVYYLPRHILSCNHTYAYSVQVRGAPNCWT